MITHQDISIIIPVYNVEKQLSDCLDSILVENNFNGEVICINDGSTDKSNLILEQYAQNYPNIVHISQNNQGVGSARNKGIKIATGEYIFFVDSDDRVLPNAIEALCQNIKGEDIVYFDIEIQNQKGVNIQHEWNNTIPITNVTGIDYFEHYHLGNVTVWSGVYRREFILANLIEFIPNVFYEDELFNIQTLFYAQKTSTLQKKIYLYKLNDSSITSSFTIKHAESLLKVTSSIYDFITTNEWVTDKTKSKVWNLYSILMSRIYASNINTINKLPYGHWQKMMYCCSNNIQDKRATKLARFSIKKACLYQDYLIPKWERKTINFLLR